MDKTESLSPSMRECKYHVVFIPKCRRRTLYEQLRRDLGEVFRTLAEHKEIRDPIRRQDREDKRIAQLRLLD
jgi:putative transposase